jgi:hypothetical protein
MQTERSAIVPGDLDAVRDALLDPELLSAWLGPWTDRGDGGARVVTDDGVTRDVSDHHFDAEGRIRWTWSPLDDPAQRSEVVVHLEQGDDGTTIRILETLVDQPLDRRVDQRVDASIHGPAGDRWTRCLLALGAVLEQHRLVVV